MQTALRIDDEIYREGKAEAARTHIWGEENAIMFEENESGLWPY